MVIEPWQAEAMAATMEASLEVVYQEMARVEEGSNQYMESRRVEYTMSSLEAVGHHLAGIPGPQESHLDDERRAGHLGSDARSVAAELHHVAAPRCAEAREPGHCDVSRRGRRRAAALPECHCGRQGLDARRRGLRDGGR